MTQMTNQIPPEQERFMRILHPYALKQHLRVLNGGTRFVHYSSADAAMSILRNKEVWMRNSSCMNDFLEVRYGLDRLYRAYRDTETGKKFQAVLNRIFDKVTIDIERVFNSWTPHLLLNTYFTCVSEHDDSEDAFGRLSMWRAYGGAASVAFVLNNSVFLNPSGEGLKAYASPIAYLDDQAFEKQLGEIGDNISRESDFLRTQGREATIGRIFNVLMFAAVCTKHLGFAEEREWRVVYCPALGESPYLKKEIRVISDVPQPIYKIPLENIAEADLRASIPDLLDRIIIGPTQYPFVLGQAFEQLLTEAGVQDAANKIRISDIPLRR